jgi:hypothetical protein
MLRGLIQNKTISSPKPPQDYMAQHRQQAANSRQLQNTTCATHNREGWKILFSKIQVFFGVMLSLGE